VRGVTQPAEKLAIDGGKPVRETLLPYARQTIADDDVDAVVEVLRSDWLTTGPKVQELEHALAAAGGAAEAVAVSNGTAALHAAVFAAGIGEGDEVLVPAMTFAATANCVVYQGGIPRFVDVDPETLLVDTEQVAAQIGERTKAVFAVDYAGQPCDYDTLRALVDARGLSLLADASHSLGAADRGRPVGSLAELTTFSFHPVKPITSGEGGAVLTTSREAAARMRSFRNHGMTSDAREREQRGAWHYEIDELGYNYRLTDIQCALALAQLRKLPRWLERRRRIADRYRDALGELPEVSPLAVRPSVEHGYHIFVVQLELERLRAGRAEVFAALRAEGIGVNVHFIPVHLHPLYRRRFGTEPGLCPVAEAAYERILTLPLSAGMTDDDAEDVISALQKVVGHYRR
jgi:perosamine synthetase